MDKLVIKGTAKLDGEYGFDIADLLSLGEPGSLTSREGHEIKVMCGLRVGELEDALKAGDTDVLVALAAVVLRRHRKTFNNDDLWDAPIGTAMIEIGERESAEEDARPPDPTLPTEQHSKSGGGSSSQTSDSPGSDPSPTGLHALPRSATSDPETLAI